MMDDAALTPEQATAKLAEMTAAYRATQPVDPQAAMNAKYADPEFRAKLDAGSPAARAEFDQLVQAAAAADPIKAAMAGTLPEIPDSDLRLMAATATWLRDIGIRDEVIQEALSGRQAPPEEYELVKRWRDDHLGNKEWSAKLLAGDAEARRQLVLANIVISAGDRKAA